MNNITIEKAENGFQVYAYSNMGSAKKFIAATWDEAVTIAKTLNDAPLTPGLTSVTTIGQTTGGNNVNPGAL